jgi:hypothetical protein
MLRLYSLGLILMGGGVIVNNPHPLDRAGLLGVVALFLHVCEGRA